MRVRWLPLKSEIGEGALVKRLREVPFVRTSGPLSRGFRIQKASKGLIAGQYIEQEVVDRVVMLPDGTEIQQELVEVTITEFEIDPSRRLGLELRNAPRSVLPFISAVSAASGFGVTVDTRMKIDLRRAVNVFRRQLGVASVVSGLECSGIELERHVTASLALSGAVDVLKQFDSLPFASHKSTVDTLRVEFELHGVKCHIDLSKAGSVRVKASDVGFVAACVRAAFEEAVA